VDAFVPKPGQSCLDILPYLRDAFAGLALPERPWLSHRSRSRHSESMTPT
jgi:hypothetical protein